MNFKQLIIKSDLCEKNPIHYNDYLVDFQEQYKDLVNKDGYIAEIEKITLEKIELQFIPEITEKSNEFSIFNNQNYDIYLDKGKYTIDEIIDGFNENYEAENCNIIVKNNDGFIIFEEINGQNFIMDCSKVKSMGYLLGFEKKIYSGSSKYVAEKRHAFNIEPIYMYIVNLDEYNPFAKINPDGTFEQYIRDFPKTIKLSFIIIQFRYMEKYLVNLGEIPHKIILNINNHDLHFDNDIIINDSMKIIL